MLRFVGRSFAYLGACIPAAIGIYYIALVTYVSAEPGTGEAAAVLAGMIAAGAYIGPALALLIGNNGHRVGAFVAWCIVLSAVVMNWTQTLSSFAERTAATEAQRTKAASTEAADRTKLARIERERGAMVFTPATAEAVAAAREAVAAAERNRVAECETRRARCREREADEAARRSELATVLGNKAATERAAALDTEAAALSRRLDNGPAAKKANPLGEALGRMLSLPASEASTLQQQAMSAVVELLIALFAALPELLRKRPVGAKRHQSEPEIDGTSRQPEVAQVPQPVPQTAIVIPERPTPRLVSSSRNEPAVSLISFAAAALERHATSKLEFGQFYLAYHAHCQALGGRPLSPTEAAEPTTRLCEECGIAIRKRGKDRYLVGVRLRARLESPGGAEAESA